MKILIIGGSGFIGTRLYALLQSQHHNVTIFDKVPPSNRDWRHIVGDVRNLGDLESAAQGMDVIYNLAAEHRDDVRPLSLYDEVNVGGARNIVAAAERVGISKIVFTSSVAVYGDSDRPMAENAPHRFINDYGRTKSEAEVEHHRWAEADPDRSLVIIRPSVVFGPGNRGNVYNLLNQIASGRFVMVGDGTNRKSMAYVENVASFAAWALNAPNGVAIYNYADKPDFDMNALVSKIREVTGKGTGVGGRLPVWAARIAGGLADVVARLSGRALPISAVRVAKFIANTEVDSRLAMTSGFKPPVALEEGLALTLRSEFGKPKP